MSSTPYLRTRALVQAKELLRALADPQLLADIPEAVRTHAEMVLKHYPGLADIQLVHESLPDLFGPAPPFSRLHGNPETDAVLDSAMQPTRKEGGLP